ncbi:A-kinase anchor protein 17A-like, partial [Saccostrea cucullata]|uniref:A-kinase anchor protein 17A-like n=1 Tax=Saccostrea cuccullata TaxID=36930 RepID=UPI002ED4C2B6
MAGTTTLCSDTSEAVELFKAQGLYLKPISKLTVCVQLPKLKEMGKSISNWEVMEKIKHMAKPHTFISLKIIKSTMEFVRMEGEADTKLQIKAIVQCLDSKTIKLSGFPEVLKVKAAEAKVSHPCQHDWDSFFRDAKNMNEMKPGERPDTVHLRDLPTKWFTNRQKDKPSEQIVKRVFENFGEVRCMDIPMLDPYRKEMTTLKSSGLQTFSFNTGITFDVYVQYKDYISFMKAMDSLRGMKLLYIMEDDEKKAYTANIKVDFDKTKHLSDKSIKKRRIEREKLEQLEREREEKVRKEREEEERRVQEEKRKKEDEEKEKRRKHLEKMEKRENRRKEREEKRRQKALERKRLEEERKYQIKIQTEERRFLLAQRKLESIRLLGELFTRIKNIKVSNDLAQREIELEEERRKQLEEETRLKEEMKRRKIESKKRRKEELLHHETELREKILKNWKEK